MAKFTTLATVRPPGDPGFPVVCQGNTAGVAGVQWAPQASSFNESGSGACTCFSDDCQDPAGLVGLWCGPNDEHCDRWAASLSLLQEGRRWGDMGGGYTRPRPNLPVEEGGWPDPDGSRAAAHRAATVEATRRHAAACRRLGFEPDGVICDHEGGPPWAPCAAALRDCLYAPGCFSRRRTRCAAWCVWDGAQAPGKAPVLDPWGNAAERVPGTVDGRTACVMAYIVRGSPLSPGQQADHAVRRARLALQAGLAFVPLASGATRNSDGREHTPEEAAAYRDMARRLAALRPAAVWAYLTAGQGTWPLCSPGVDWARLGYREPLPVGGDWRLMMAEAAETALAWRAR